MASTFTAHFFWTIDAYRTARPGRLIRPTNVAATSCHVLSPVFSQLGYGTDTAAASTARRLLSDGQMHSGAPRHGQGVTQHRVRLRHGRRTALPPKGCKAGVSARSRECYQRVNRNRVRHGPENGTVRRYDRPMIAPEEPGEPAGAGEPAGRVSPLRGAGVDVDVRRLGRVVAATCLLALGVLVVVLSVAGAQKNAQISRL